VPKKRLTEEGVARLKPPPEGKQVDYYDAVERGLVLRVNYGGRKTWRALHYVRTVAKSGKLAGQPISMPTMHPLGRWPAMGLKQARDAARAFLADPRKAAEGGTYAEVADSFVARHVKASGLRTAPEIERCLRVYLMPQWQHRAFRDLKRSDVTALLDHVEDNHGRRQADVVLGLIRSMMNWYALRNDDYVSPIARGMKRHNGTEARRSRILSDAEIAALWTVAPELGGYGALCQVLLLTGQRRGKVATMTWADLVDGTWVIPTEKREKGNGETLRLAPLALDIIAAQPRIAGRPHVFTAAGWNPARGKLELDRRLRASLGSMEPFVLHDLRRTARSLMARAGVAPHVAERVLGHAIRGVEGTYDRHSYADEKADALAKLAKLVASMVTAPAIRTGAVA
jgi:integrase